MSDGAGGWSTKSVGRKPLSQRVYESLKLSIINGELQPGQRLTETEIARQLDVSTTPVREALRRLAAEAFVEILPWRGVVVQGYSAKDLLDAYQCREALEGLACRLAAANMDSSGLKKLRKLCEESARASAVTELVEINSAIHDLIFSYSNNARLSGLLGLFNDVIVHDRNVTAYSDARRRSIEAEHQAIVEALEQRDGDKAETAMRTHVQNGLKFVLERLAPSES